MIYNLRRNGIASLLVENLIKNLNNNPLLNDCKAIYLHVLTTNTVAIRFYEKFHFKRFKLLPLYYSINGIFCDGYSYVYHINGSQPPFHWFLLLNPKCYLFLFKQILTNICQFIIKLPQCDRFKGSTLRPNKFLKQILKNIISTFCPKVCFNKKVKSNLYVC